MEIYCKDCGSEHYKKMEKSGKNSVTSVKRAVIITLLAMNVKEAHPKVKL